MTGNCLAGFGEDSRILIETLENDTVIRGLSFYSILFIRWIKLMFYFIRDKFTLCQFRYN